VETIQTDNACLLLKFRVFWDVLPCSQIDVYRRFRGAYCLHHRVIIALMMEAARTEASVGIQLRTRQYIPEDPEFEAYRLLGLPNTEQ